jgi:hypothetical protein
MRFIPIYSESENEIKGIYIFTCSFRLENNESISSCFQFDKKSFEEEKLTEIFNKKGTINVMKAELEVVKEQTNEQILEGKKEAIRHLHSKIAAI